MFNQKILPRALGAIAGAILLAGSLAATAQSNYGSGSTVDQSGVSTGSSSDMNTGSDTSSSPSSNSDSSYGSGTDSSTSGSSGYSQSQSTDAGYSSQSAQSGSSSGAVLSDQMRNPVWQRNLGETDGRQEGYSIQTMPNLPK